MYISTMIRKLNIRYNIINTEASTKFPQVPESPVSTLGISQSFGSSKEMASNTSDHPADVLI